MKGINIEKSAIVCDKGRLIGYNHVLGYFFCADENTGHVKPLKGYVPEDGWILFGAPCKNETSVWFPPCMAQDAVEIRNKRIYRYPIIFNREIPHRFMKAFIEGRKLFLLPGCARGIVVFDIENCKETVIAKWYGQYRRLIPDHLKNAEIFGKTRYGNYLKEGDRIYLPLLHAPAVLELNIVSYETKIHYFECRDKTGFLAVYGGGKRKYLLTRSSNDILELRENKIVNTYHVEMGRDTFGRSVIQDDKIFVLARNTATLAVFDLITKAQKTMDLSGYFGFEQETDFGAFINDKGVFWISESHSGISIRMDARDGNISIAETFFEMTEADFLGLMEEKAETDRPLMENSFFSIADMLHMHMDRTDKKTEKNIGYKLYSQL